MRYKSFMPKMDETYIQQKLKILLMDIQNVHLLSELTTKDISITYRHSFIYIKNFPISIKEAGKAKEISCLYRLF